MKKLLSNILRKICPPYNRAVMNVTYNRNVAENLLCLINQMKTLIPYTNSQYGQDIFVSNFFKHKENGFFVEIGAAQGIDLSNTFYLEKKYNWKGLLVEGNPEFYDELRKNRSQVYIETCCVSEREGLVEFVQSDALSGIKEYFSEKHKQRVQHDIKNVIFVPAVRFEQLFEKYRITNIDYLSVDTEGNELAVLKSINFDNVDIKLIGVEIEQEDRHQSINDLLSSHGYSIIQQLRGDYFFSK